MNAISTSASDLTPYLAPIVDKLPGCDAPPVEPPPALKERIMAVVRAEAHAATRPDGAVVLPASPSSAGAPGAGGTLTLGGHEASLRVWGLPPAAAGCGYRVWLLPDAEPRVPLPGPLLALDARGCADVVLKVAGTGELAVVPEGAPSPRAVAVLRVGLPPGVAAHAGR